MAFAKRSIGHHSADAQKNADITYDRGLERLEAILDRVSAGDGHKAVVLAERFEALVTSGMMEAYLTDGQPTIPITSSPLALGGGAPTMTPTPSPTDEATRIGTELINTVGLDRTDEVIEFHRLQVAKIGSLDHMDQVNGLVESVAHVPGAARTALLDYLSQVVDRVIGGDPIVAEDPAIANSPLMLTSDKNDRQRLMQYKQDAMAALNALVIALLPHGTRPVNASSPAALQQQGEHAFDQMVRELNNSVKRLFGIDRNPGESIQDFIARAHVAIPAPAPAFDALTEIKNVFPRINRGETDQAYTARIKDNLYLVQLIENGLRPVDAMFDSTATPTLTLAGFADNVVRAATSGINTRNWVADLYMDNASLHSVIDRTDPPLVSIARLVSFMNAGTAPTGLNVQIPTP